MKILAPFSCGKLLGTPVLNYVQRHEDVFCA